MKKALLTLLAFAIFAGVLSAQTQNITVSASVNTQLYFVSIPETLGLGTLNLAAGTYASGTAYIRANLQSWKLRVSADSSTLRQWDGTAYVTNGNPTTIPYTFSFNTASAIAAEKIVSQPLSTTTSEATTATFSRKTGSGSSGEAFVLRIDVPAEPAGTTWDSAEYQVVIYVTLSAT